MSDRNVTPNTATSSQDRLQEIRARLDAAAEEAVLAEEWDAAADIMWLLAEVERLAKESHTHASAQQNRTESGTELLRNTNLSVGNELCDADDSVVQGVTKWQPAWKAAAKKWRKRALMYERVKS